MVDLKQEVSLIDFGYSTYCQNKESILYRYCGTPYYMPPEMIKKIGYKGNILIKQVILLIYGLLVFSILN